MTLTKIDSTVRAIRTSESRLQKSADAAYSSLVELFTAAEDHYRLCSITVEKLRLQATHDNRLRTTFELGSEEFEAWAAKKRVESVLWAVRNHQIIGRAALGDTDLNRGDGRIPPPYSGT